MEMALAAGTGFAFDQATLSVDRIVLGVSGEVRRDPARQVAVDLARALGSSLHLVHAWNYGGVAGWPMAYSEPTQTGEALERAANAKMLAARRATDELLGGRSLAHIEQGTPANVLVQIANQIAADLIVVAGRTRHGTAAMLMRSVSEDVLEKANCPVLVVHGDDVVWPPAEVITCFDGSPQAELAWSYASAISNAMKVSSRTLQVVPRGTMAQPDREPLVSTLTGRPLSALSHEIGPHPSAIIALGTSGHGVVPLTRIGSVAMHLLRTTNAPLLIVPPAAVKERSRATAYADR
jgi:nucleotide-binding universal stress UspA family protein